MSKQFLQQTPRNEVWGNNLATGFESPQLNFFPVKRMFFLVSLQVIAHKNDAVVAGWMANCSSLPDIFGFDSGGRTFLQRGSPTPTSLASAARIFFSPNWWFWSCHLCALRELVTDCKLQVCSNHLLAAVSRYIKGKSMNFIAQSKDRLVESLALPLLSKSIFKPYGKATSLRVDSTTKTA